MAVFLDGIIWTHLLLHCGCNNAQSWASILWILQQLHVPVPGWKHALQQIWPVVPTPALLLVNELKQNLSLEIGCPRLYTVGALLKPSDYEGWSALNNKFSCTRIRLQCRAKSYFTAALPEQRPTNLSIPNGLLILTAFQSMLHKLQTENFPGRYRMITFPLRVYLVDKQGLV